MTIPTKETSILVKFSVEISEGNTAILAVEPPKGFTREQAEAYALGIKSMFEAVSGRTRQMLYQDTRKSFIFID